nr:hypothetical protein [Campylobacter sp. LR264d]
MPILTNSAIDKKDNILNRKSENLFNTKSIFENIIDLKPIAIIDEPHLLIGDKFSQNFKKLNSLYFRFGATFPKDKDYVLSNMAYRLDSILAFNEYLVKQIQVHTLVESNENLRLLCTDSKNKKAKFSYFLSGIEKFTKIKKGESLGSIDSKFHNITLENLAKSKVYLSDKTTLETKNNYKLSNEEISNLLKKAIELHFKKRTNFIFSKY